MTTATQQRKYIYNLVTDDGTESSVTAYIDGQPYTATKEQSNFRIIVEKLRAGAPKDEVLEAFDTGMILSKKFEPLSERVRVASGKIYFDGDHQDDALTRTILRFLADGLEFQPLVNFMEKIATNPNEHSRENLFRWIGKHDFAIAPDGDIIAYKGVTSGPDLKSQNSGTAMVNGEVITGKIPNVPGTIIEMPRSDVNHNPSNGCSTGLHVANWSFAKSFTSGPTLRIKVNPRDVVSVPTDSNDDKMRVCRYRVLDVVQAEDKEALFIGDPERTHAIWAQKRQEEAEARFLKEQKQSAPAVKKSGKARKAAQPKTKKVRFPKYYEEYTKEHFNLTTYNDLRWLATQWEVNVAKPVTKPKLVAALLRAAKRRKATW